MKAPLVLTTAIALALSPTLFAQSPANDQLPNEQSAQQQSGQQSSEQSGQSSNPSHEEKEFVKNASSGNHMEIQLGQYILDHSQNQQAKQLAQTLIADHQQNEQLLQQAAKQANVSVPDKMIPLHKAHIQDLKGKSGEELNRDFAFGAIADHVHDLLDFNYAAQHLQNPQLKQYAQQTIPALQKHLQLANQLAQSVAGVSTNALATER